MDLFQLHFLLSDRAQNIWDFQIDPGNAVPESFITFTYVVYARNIRMLHCTPFYFPVITGIFKPQTVIITVCSWYHNLFYDSDSKCFFQGSDHRHSWFQSTAWYRSVGQLLQFLYYYRISDLQAPATWPVQKSFTASWNGSCICFKFSRTILSVQPSLLSIHISVLVYGFRNISDRHLLLRTAEAEISAQNND